MKISYSCWRNIDSIRNILDQYTNLSGATNSGTLTYNNNGNLKTEGNKTYIYDYNNRLIEVNIGTGNLVKYSYDILGRRTKKIDSSTSATTIYVYAGDNIISEYRTTGSLTLKKNYINGIGTDSVIAYDADESTNQGQISFCQNRVLPYSSEFTQYGYTSIVNDCNNAQNSGTGIVTNRYYYHTNQLGSVIALTNSTGTVVQVYSYDAFGKVYISNSGSLVPLDTYTGSTYSNSRLYTGREYDKEIGMYYLRARYYNANTGKFISRDPVGQNDQVNLYTYVKNSPLGYTDRNGKNSKPLSTWDESITWVGDILDGIFGAPQLYGDLNPSPVIEKDIGIVGEAVIIGGGLFTFGKGGAVKRTDDLFKRYKKYIGEDAEDIMKKLKKDGYEVIKRDSNRDKSKSEIIEIKNPGNGNNITQVQISPGGGRHGPNPYIKFSTSDDGIIKIVNGPQSSYFSNGLENAFIHFTK